VEIVSFSKLGGVPMLWLPKSMWGPRPLSGERNFYYHRGGKKGKGVYQGEPAHLATILQVEEGKLINFPSIGGKGVSVLCEGTP